MRTTRNIPAFQSWEDAYEFASAEALRAFEASQAGDINAALALNETARLANAIAKQMLDGES